VRIIDSGAAVARQTLNILKSESLLNLTDKAGKHLLYSNLQTETLDYLTREIANREVSLLDF
jgi:glutamate racemase